MIKRIKSLISVKNLSSSQFADLIGVQRSNISHILSGRNKPSLDFILKISEHFPSVSVEWLLKGKGEMFNLEEKNFVTSPSQLDIQMESSAFEEEISIKLNEGDVESVKKDSSAETLENSQKVFSNIASPEKDQIVELASIADNEKEIEQIMVLYKNGSFRVYTPQK